MRQLGTRLRAIAIASALTLVMAACGGTAATPTSGGSGGPAASTCGTDPVTLSIWGGYPEVDAVFKKAGEAFKTTHPNVDLVVFSTDLRGFEQKLTTALPSKTAGDIIVRTTNFLARFIDQGLFAPLPDDLNKLFTGGSYDPAIVKDGTYNDKTWSVPLFNNRTALYYNKDMYAEAGLSAAPTSMDQIFDYARKLAKTDANGQVSRSGLSLRLSGQGSGVAEKFWIMLMQYGKTLISETSPGKWQAEYNGPEGVKLLQTYVDLLRDKVDSPNIEHDAKAFETKATAMLLRESWVVAEIATSAPDLVDHYATVSPPVGDLLTIESMFVPAASPNAACAWDFIRFLSEPEQQISVVELSGWIPSRSDLNMTDFLKANPAYQGFFDRPKDLKLTLTPPLPEFDEIETKLATHLVDAYADYANLAGQPDKIQALLNTWADETNQILKKNGHFAG